LGCLGQSPVATARGHTPNKHASIEIMLLHADTITEDGSARERAGRIDSDNANGFALLACMGSECVSDGAFAGARRSRNTHAVSSAEGRGNTSHNLWDFCTMSFDVRYELRQGPLVASKHPLNEIHGGSILCRGHREVTLRMYAQERKTGSDQDR
jgi:hypothetical protein